MARWGRHDRLDVTVPNTAEKSGNSTKTASRNVEWQRLATEAEYNQRQQDEERERQRREHDAFRASASRNLDAVFMEVAGHRVFTIPYANVYALANELAAVEKPTDDQGRLSVH
jgi:hypothetical protein